jgi:hypothetical protein
MSAHTPGPWRFFDGHRKDDLVSRHLVGANGQGFAKTVGLGDPEDIANAHLIAAARELLAALRPFAEQKCYGAEAGYAPHVCLNTPTCPTCAARAAIAKAEGRQP